MAGSQEIPADLLVDIHDTLAKLSGFALGVAKAIPGMGDLATPLAERADSIHARLRDHTERAVLATHFERAGQ